MADRPWGLLVKCNTPPEDDAPTDASLQALLARLPGPASDKRRTGGDRDFTLMFWVDAVDANSAVAAGTQLVRDAARDLGLPWVRVVRAHAASENGRRSPFPGTRARLGVPDTWSVLYRHQAPRGAAPFTPDELAGIAARLPGGDALVTLHSDKEKLLVSDGRAFTARFWASATTPAAAIRSGREALLAAIEATGSRSNGGTIVRAQVTSPAARDGDTFPGGYDRPETPDEETR